MPPVSPVVLAAHAMATRFELVLHGENPVALRAAGEEALAEIGRVENQLSLYRNTSEIAHVNARAAREPVRVSPAVFRLLSQARDLGVTMAGAFDVTIAPLVRCWGFMGGSGALPAPAALAEAKAKVGWSLIDLEASASTVRFLVEGVMLDLGAIGKGYAIECAIEVLREGGVSSAILHGGTSTVYALGCPPDSESWNVAIERSNLDEAASGKPALVRTESNLASSPAAPALLTVIPLRDEALSVSAIWGRSFESGGKVYGHVIDPRTGEPVGNSLLSAVVLPSATETDALSTALLTLGSPGLALLKTARPEVRALVVQAATGQLRVEGIGKGFESFSGPP